MGNTVITTGKGWWLEIKRHTRFARRSALWASLVVGPFCLPSSRSMLPGGLECSQRPGYVFRRAERLDLEVELVQYEALSGVELAAGKAATRDALGPEGRWG
jgi:hypothetical protein